VFERDYFRTCLAAESRTSADGLLTRVFTKARPTPAAAACADRGWTFGILTSGPSPRAAEMARCILALDLPAVEVIFCGPRPDGAPDDPRVRAIDLDRPEPRGWITRKKNLIAREARHENLCLLHDRYRITTDWARALRGTEPSRGVCTFPQVYRIDGPGRFTQRYADYQVLHQRSGIQAALAARVFAGEHVLYMAYDDFAETAFCCGGLYVTSRTILQRVPQDEGLYHGEWEDVVFGLECQRAGIPHRVEPGLTVESLLPHPMALTRTHDLSPDGTPQLGHLHVAREQAAAGTNDRDLFKPVIGMARLAYYDKVRRRFNAIPWLAASDHLGATDVEDCTGLADFWHRIEQRVNHLRFRERSDVSAVVHFLSDTIYNWPNCEVLSWVRDNERALRPTRSLDSYTVVAGWGTGSLFRATHGSLGRRLDHLIDGDAGRWGSRVETYEVHGPEVLRSLDPATTAVVVFSCAFDAIAAQVATRGPFAVVRATDVVEERRFRPLCDMVRYFEEVEQHYPILFAQAAAEGALRTCPQ
jgi:hypothetical protein